MYRDGGEGILRPVAITVGGDPVPGICAGLLQGLEGMRVGGRRTVTVPPSLGFGNQPVLAPYGERLGGWQALQAFKAHAGDSCPPLPTCEPRFAHRNHHTRTRAGIVPAGSTLTYEVQLLRLSRRGPEELYSGTAKCGSGSANQRSEGCADITAAEFI